MKLTFGEVERLLMYLHGVPEDRRVAMRSRIQHLQRLGMPTLPPAGRGVRIEYGEDAVFQLLVAFELAALNWSAQALTDFVIGNWPKLRALIDAGVAAIDTDYAAIPTEFAVIHPDALSTIRSDVPKSTVEIASSALMVTWAFRSASSTRSSHIVLDLVRLGRRAAIFLRDGAKAADAYH